MTRHDGTMTLAMFSTTRWQAIRPGVPTPLKTPFATPIHQDPRCCIGFQPPRGHLSGLGSHCNCPTLSYKRLRQTPLHNGRSRPEKGSCSHRQGRLEQYNSILPLTYSITLRRPEPHKSSCPPKYRSGFATLPPVLLQEQPAVVFLLEGALVSWLLAIDEHGGHEDLHSSGRRSVIPYIHMRTELYYTSLPCLSLIFFWPL
jgi:hypothetical protein